jgi:hypothetical protein
VRCQVEAALKEGGDRERESRFLYPGRPNDCAGGNAYLGLLVGEGANASNYQDVWLAVQNIYDINNIVPTLSISGFGTTLGSQDPSGDLHIIHWRTITFNAAPGSTENAIFAFNLIKIPSGS